VEAHANTVSSLFVSRAGTLLSGSWDWSAKVWVDSLKCVMTLSGHEDSVWAVAVMPECGVMLTGSADTSIRLWLAGACKATLPKAHDLAVRDLAVASNSKFLSTGNDGYVKMWNVEVLAGGNVKATPMWQVLAHDNFIYSLCLVHPESETWAVAGEYSGVRIFSKDQVGLFDRRPFLDVQLNNVIAAPPSLAPAGHFRLGNYRFRQRRRRGCVFGRQSVDLLSGEKPLGE
jgi:phospholipase A-2-activating protein